MKRVICVLIVIASLFLVSCGAKTPATPTEAVTTATTVAEATTAARTEAGNILDFFASDRGKKEFEEWKKKIDKSIKAANAESPDKIKSEA